jgi:hypothetical protein
MKYLTVRDQVYEVVSEVPQSVSVIQTKMRDDTMNCNISRALYKLYLDELVDRKIVDNKYVYWRKINRAKP